MLLDWQSINWLRAIFNWVSLNQNQFNHSSQLEEREIPVRAKEKSDKTIQTAQCVQGIKSWLVLVL